ncbi:hypothetical protein DL546_001632 [Coniochaeta pulveracea]|uniref:Hydroxyacyl-thioester dehydratase type 2, mitochondrial n=1 Tax=Coniochaeta pulveracea TaxID=177199 RepID=A0A420Y6Q5_9PEZI|nr:hypothetical protein DL546_001632 [Coniochaeta pulveracea]
MHHTAALRQSFASYLRSVKTLLASHPPKHLYDHLSPTQTRLLGQSLQPHLTPQIQPIYLPNGPLPGTPLPLGHHLVYFPTPPLTLMSDGTDADHAPGGVYTRRMWAGGSLSFPATGQNVSGLEIGRDAVCVESVDGDEVQVKGVAVGDGEEVRLTGKEKVFVNVRRRYGPLLGIPDDIDRVRKSPSIEEIRTLVFMAENPPSAPNVLQQPEERRVVKIPGPPPTLAFELIPDARLLFHFSALSFNAHSIHLDRRYAQDVEGYPDLLVQGPLLLCLMLKGIEARIREVGGMLELRKLEYRNLRPLFVGARIRESILKQPTKRRDVHP